MGREAECEILACRLPLHESADSNLCGFAIYTDCSVIAAPSDLPDGKYTAYFEGYALKTTLHRGVWLPLGPVFRDAESSVFSF